MLQTDSYIVSHLLGLPDRPGLERLIACRGMDLCTAGSLSSMRALPENLVQLPEFDMTGGIGVNLPEDIVNCSCTTPSQCAHVRMSHASSLQASA